MKIPSFEDYLSDIHASQYQGLDDEMPENYEEWLSGLDSEAWLRYGTAYGLDLRITILEATLDLLKP